MNENILQNFERIKVNEDLEFDKESICIKIFTHLIELFEFFDCQIDENVINALLGYHIHFLNILKKILGQRQLYLLKHLELLGDGMRNIYTIFTHFYEKNFFHHNSLNEPLLNLINRLKDFYEFSHIISKDVVSQISVLLLFYQSRLKKVYSFH